MSVLDYWKEVDAETMAADVERIPAIKFSQFMPASYQVVWSDDLVGYFGVRHRGSRYEHIHGPFDDRWAARRWCIYDDREMRACAKAIEEAIGEEPSFDANRAERLSQS